MKGREKVWLPSGLTRESKYLKKSMVMVRPWPWLTGGWDWRTALERVVRGLFVYCMICDLGGLDAVSEVFSVVR